MRTDWGRLTKDYVIREGADTKTKIWLGGMKASGGGWKSEKVRWVNQAVEYKCVGRMRNVYIVKRDWVKGKGKGGR